MIRLCSSLIVLAAVIVALAAGDSVKGQQRQGFVPVDKGGAVQGKFVDAEAVFRKFAGKDGKLTLDGFKRLLKEINGQALMFGAPAGGAPVDPANLKLKGGRQ
jgi:hypothetical protein